MRADVLTFEFSLQAPFSFEKKTTNVSHSCHQATVNDLLMIGRPPCDAVLINGDGVRSRAFTHPIQLPQRDVQAHEVIQSVFGDGGRSGAAQFAAVQAQDSAHLLEHQIVRQHEAPGHRLLPKTQTDPFTTASS